MLRDREGLSLLRSDVSPVCGSGEKIQSEVKDAIEHR